MTATRGNGPRIPRRQTNIGLRGNLNTSATSEGPSRITGTSNAVDEGYDYVDIPPPSTKHSPAPTYWTLEKISIYSGFALIALTIIFFFFRMDLNIETIKVDVKEEKSHIEKLDEKANKQASSVENIANSVQRLEGEIRRTQDFVNNRKK